MKTLLTHSRALAVPLLLGWGASAVAQSLGTAVADAWIGRPLEMTVPARFSPADAGDECIRAEVFYGDVRLRPDQVRTTVLGPLGNRSVRVEVDVPIDEPVVTVSLRAGCHGSITRTYTLLPAAPSAAMLAAENTLERRTPVPVVLGPAAAAARLAAAAPPAEPAAAKRLPVVRRTSEPREPRQGQGMAKVARAKPPTVHGPRLRMEPLAIEPQAVLRVSATLSQPGGDAARRAAAALLWQALNADPQEILRTSALLRELETEVAGLRLANGQTRAELAALRQRLDAPPREPWYRAPVLLQTVSVLLLSMLAAAGFLWWTRRRDGTPAWYAPANGLATDPRFEAAAPDAPATAPAAPQRERRVPPSVVPTLQPLAMPGPAVEGAAPDASLEQPAAQPTEGELRVETLAALFQEIEFLSAVGVTTDAVLALQSYVGDSARPAPLAFYELMRLHARSGDQAALGLVRGRYVEAFGRQPPAVETITAATGLEAMPELTDRITRAWGTPEAPRLIETTLFGVSDQVLTLQAGRDLLSLYEIAVALVADAAAPAAAEDAPHDLAPWAHATDQAQARVAVERVAEPQGGAGFGLDVDLGVPAAPQLAEEPPRPAELLPLEFAPLLAEFELEASREAAARAKAEQEDAFSAAVASERLVSRY